MRRFEDVVAAANERLLVMSDGRFELVRSDEKEDVPRADRAVDAGRRPPHRDRRDPRTLSGGETFYVSLCLALGMADVVTAEAGGIDLGHAVRRRGVRLARPAHPRAVLAELGRLRAGGRVVGVVSHVEALKQSIADRIEVRPTRRGPQRADGPGGLTSGRPVGERHGGGHAGRRRGHGLDHQVQPREASSTSSRNRSPGRPWRAARRRRRPSHTPRRGAGRRRAGTR